MATATAREPRFGFHEHQVFWNEQGSIVCACCHIPYPRVGHLGVGAMERDHARDHGRNRP